MCALSNASFLYKMETNALGEGGGTKYTKWEGVDNDDGMLIINVIIQVWRGPKK